MIVTARSADKLDELAGRLTRRRARRWRRFPADLTSDADRRRLLEAAAERFDGLDVLINNAGVASAGHFADGTEAVLRQVMEVNFFAPAELMRLAVPVLTRGRQPAIVNVASMCGRRGMPAWTEYSASKFALCGLTEALRAELARFDIDVLLVVPGLTRSDLAGHMLRSEARMKIDFDRGMPVEDVAAEHPERPAAQPDRDGAGLRRPLDVAVQPLLPALAGPAHRPAGAAAVRLVSERVASSEPAKSRACSTLTTRD